MQHNDGKDSFLGSLLVLPVELWKGIAGWNTNQIDIYRALMAIQTCCLGALHGEQSLTVLNRCGMLVINKIIIWKVLNSYDIYK